MKKNDDSLINIIKMHPIKYFSDYFKISHLKHCSFNYFPCTFADSSLIEVDHLLPYFYSYYE